MSEIIPFDAFLAGATRYEWCCLDCPRLYVTHRGALRHSIIAQHDYAGREYLGGFGYGDAEVHPFVACIGRLGKTVCGYCSRERGLHNVRQELLRPRLMTEFRWLLCSPEVLAPLL